MTGITATSSIRRLGFLWLGSFLPGCLLLCIALLPVAVSPAQASSSNVVLADQCPPSFALDQNNQCRLRNLYQLYDSLQNRGLGGLKTALPEHRDGFSPQQIDLGRLLFFDPVLSADKNLSCANCHNPDLGFSDGMDRSVGARGQISQRSAPTLWNSAFLQVFFWDARAQSLEEQAIGPLFSDKEMANTPAQLLADLKQVPTYPKLFEQAFPNAKDALIIDNIATALAAFQSSLISLNSPYDRYAHGDAKALSPNQLEGLNVFRSFVARCSQCHTPPLFTNQQVAVIGTPEPAGLPRDIGAAETFNAKRLTGGFKVPTLRNIARTAPYMHSGRFATLRETAEFYTKGRGHAVPEGEELLLHWHISDPNLTDSELDRLVDFMGALSDESFMPRIPTQVPSGLLTSKTSVSLVTASGD
jgi:cytochrome c peroxidase